MAVKLWTVNFMLANHLRITLVQYSDLCRKGQRRNTSEPTKLPADLSSNSIPMKNVTNVVIKNHRTSGNRQEFCRR